MEDTKIIFEQVAKFGEYDVLYQKWFWDGVTAESIIFANEDIEGIEEQDIIKDVESSFLVNKNSEATFTRSDSGYTFINFNFEID